MQTALKVTQKFFYSAGPTLNPRVPSVMWGGSVYDFLNFFEKIVEHHTLRPKKANRLPQAMDFTLWTAFLWRGGTGEGEVLGFLSPLSTCNRLDGR